MRFGSGHGGSSNENADSGQSHDTCLLDPNNSLNDGILSILATIENIRDVNEPPFYRPVPTTSDSSINPALIMLMKQCWTEEPTDRPSFEEVAKTLRVINKGKYVDFRTLI